MVQVKCKSVKRTPSMNMDQDVATDEEKDPDYIESSSLDDTWKEDPARNKEALFWQVLF